MTRAAWILLIVPCAASVVAGGCASDPRQGYSFEASFSQDARTVHVPIFHNTTFSHGLEAELTDAIVKEIQRSTPWRVVSDERAQTTLSGTITDSRMRLLSLSRESGLAQELAVQLTAEFSWKDNRTGRVLAARRDFTSSESFIPSRGVQERLAVGENAAVQELARAIVHELRSGW